MGNNPGGSPLTDADWLFYCEGSFVQPAGMYAKVRLSQVCPAVGRVTTSGVYVARTNNSKQAALLTWSSILAAVAWAARRSSAVRTDLRRILLDVSLEVGREVDVPRPVRTADDAKYRPMPGDVREGGGMVTRITCTRATSWAVEFVETPGGSRSAWPIAWWSDDAAVYTPAPGVSRDSLQPADGAHAAEVAHDE